MKEIFAERMLIHTKILLAAVIVAGYAIYAYLIVPDAIQGHDEFLIMLAILLFTFFVTRYGIMPFLKRKWNYSLWRIIAAVVICWLLVVIMLTVLSLWSGALTWQGFDKFHVENFYPIMLPILIPQMFAIVCYLLRFLVDLIKVHLLLYEHRRKILGTLHYKLYMQGLNPHFLFNTLPTIQQLVRINHDDAVPAMQLLQQVSKFYMDHQDKFYISLEEELQQVGRMLEIYTIRKCKSLYLRRYVDGAVSLHALVPPMLLTNLIENICQYGVLTDPDRPATLHIEPWADKGLRIIVFNHIAEEPLAGVERGHGQLQRMERGLKSLHADNTVLLRNEGQTFCLELLLHDTSSALQQHS